MKTTPITLADVVDWIQLRAKLWRDTPGDEHLEEMNGQLANPSKFGQFIARDAQGKTVGFIECSIRTDYVNGTEASPVAFLEGIYVLPRARRQGVAKNLVRAFTRWAREKRCAELASDAPLRNRVSQAVHKSLGFQETERVVYFKRPLR